MKFTGRRSTTKGPTSCTPSGESSETRHSSKLSGKWPTPIRPWRKSPTAANAVLSQRTISCSSAKRTGSGLVLRCVSPAAGFAQAVFQSGGRAAYVALGIARQPAVPYARRSEMNGKKQRVQVTAEGVVVKLGAGVQPVVDPDQWLLCELAR